MKKTLSMNVFCSLCYASIKALRRALVAIIESFSSAGSQTLFSACAPPTFNQFLLSFI